MADGAAIEARESAAAAARQTTRPHPQPASPSASGAARPRPAPRPWSAGGERDAARTCARHPTRRVRQDPENPLVPLGGPIGGPIGEPFRSTIKNGPPPLAISAGQAKKSREFADRAPTASAASGAREPAGFGCKEATARTAPLVGSGGEHGAPLARLQASPAGIDRILRSPSCRSVVRSEGRSGNRSGAPLRTDPHPSPSVQVRAKSHPNSQPDLIYRTGPFRST